MNKDKIYTIRFDEKEWEGICKRAERQDMPIAQYIRKMIDLGEREGKGSDDLTW